MARHRLYGVFWTNPETGRAMWALSRSGRVARQRARELRALVLSMSLPCSPGAWDAPTFRACADRRECDYRPGGVGGEA